MPGKGANGHQHIRGRNRQLLVDTRGSLLAAHIGPSHENDRVGGQAALQKLSQLGFKRLPAVLADAGEAGQRLAEWARHRCGWHLETTSGPTDHNGFTPVPTRWVVERAMSWVQWDRRLSRDYECETRSAAATLHVSSICRIIRKF